MSREDEKKTSAPLPAGRNGRHGASAPPASGRAPGVPRIAEVIGRRPLRASANGHLPAPSEGNGVPCRADGWRARVVMTGLPLQSCSVLLARGKDRVLVDTGFATHDAVLLQGLRREGVAPEQITAVINTHFHLDHIGCNALFPRAPVYASRRDYDWAMRIYDSVCGGEERRDVFRTFYPEVTDEEFERMDQARLLQLIRWLWDPATLGDRGRYQWVDQGDGGGAGPLPFSGLHLVPTPGHTPGHLSVAVEGDDGDYLIVGDARAFRDDATVGYDMPPHNLAQFQASRRILDAFAGTLIPGHDEPFAQSPAADAWTAAAPPTPAAAGVRA